MSHAGGRPDRAALCAQHPPPARILLTLPRAYRRLSPPIAASPADSARRRGPGPKSCAKTDPGPAGKATLAARAHMDVAQGLGGVLIRPEWLAR